LSGTKGDSLRPIPSKFGRLRFADNSPHERQGNGLRSGLYVTMFKERLMKGRNR